MSRLDEIAQSLRGTDVSRTADLTRMAMEEGLSAMDILNKGLLPGMQIIGEQFRTDEIFLPDRQKLGYHDVGREWLGGNGPGY
jgi:methanogenic corrinoid protein MtbC1